MSVELSGYFSQYDAARNLQNKSFKSACYAPFVSLLFDPRGFVRACCQDLTHSVGNVVQQRLQEIWNGSELTEFRRRLIDYDLPAACGTCSRAIEQGDYDGVFARQFDGGAVESTKPDWPRSLWFALSNTCNLECVQCFGDFSSSIRKNREDLPPLPKVYDDNFFEDLRPFLAHLESAVFIGGEPFLSPEAYRVFDLMIEDGIEIPCYISTNGTVFNDRVQGILARLNCHITVSLDGSSPETVESIRRNTRFDVLMTHIKRFVDMAHERQRSFGLSFCLMPQNHHEFADFLVLAEELNCDVSVNRVNHPPQFSMNCLSTTGLKAIVEDWEHRSAAVESRLDRHRGIWISELTRLQKQLEHKPSTPEPFFLTGICNRFEIPEGRARVADTAALDAARQELMEWGNAAVVDEIVIDSGDAILRAPTGFAGLKEERLRGKSFADALWALRELYGPEGDVTYENAGPARIDRTMDFGDFRKKRAQLRWVAFAQGEGAVVLAAIRT